MKCCENYGLDCPGADCPIRAVLKSERVCDLAAAAVITLVIVLLWVVA